MKDKNGKQVQVGDRVKLFGGRTYIIRATHPCGDGSDVYIALEGREGRFHENEFELIENKPVITYRAEPELAYPISYAAFINETKVQIELGSMGSWGFWEEDSWDEYKIIHDADDKVIDMSHLDKEAARILSKTNQNHYFVYALWDNR